jgi:hypothetical protein
MTATGIKNTLGFKQEPIVLQIDLEYQSSYGNVEILVHCKQGDPGSIVFSKTYNIAGRDEIIINDTTV